MINIFCKNLTAANYFTLFAERKYCKQLLKFNNG